MLITYSRPIILASTSKVRKEILESCKLDFQVVEPLYNEDQEKTLLDLPPQKLAMFLASQKALSLSALSVSEKFYNSFVIGADQVCEFENNDISKSKNIDEAISQLTKLAGKIHYQNNASVVAYQGKIVFENFTRVTLKMRDLTPHQIIDYVTQDKSFGCAGSYKYESLGKHLFEKVEGDYYAILGLSIQPLLNFLYSQKIINF